MTIGEQAYRALKVRGYSDADIAAGAALYKQTKPLFFEAGFLGFCMGVILGFGLGVLFGWGQ